MSAQSSDPHAAAKEATRQFVREAMARLDTVPGYTEGVARPRTWIRLPEGHYILGPPPPPPPQRVPWWTNVPWLQRIPGCEACVAALTADPTIGRHLGRWVGTEIGPVPYEPWRIIHGTLRPMLDSDEPVFSDALFDKEWTAVMAALDSDDIPFKTIVLFPLLQLPTFPISLNDQIVLDRFTEDEVTLCVREGLMRPEHRPIRVTGKIEIREIIFAQVSVGLRREILLPKLILNEHHLGAAQTTEDGRFGRRPALRPELLVEDILVALRLFKATQIKCAGYYSWHEGRIGGLIQMEPMERWPYVAGFSFSKDEVPAFQDLWKTLEQQADYLSFALHRFNLAFDRKSEADRIVDLVIAGESFFLSGERNELRFRFALRASKFIEHSAYRQQDVYRIMLKAYDVRSALVHGGTPTDTKLPNDPDASLATFIDTIEELMRRALCKALAMRKDGTKLQKSEYWDALLFP